MAQGRVLRTLQKHDLGSLYWSAVTRVTHMAIEYPLSEVPRKSWKAPSR